jgi:hypothetical protein
VLAPRVPDDRVGPECEAHRFAVAVPQFALLAGQHPERGRRRRYLGHRSCRSNRLTQNRTAQRRG